VREIGQLFRFRRSAARVPISRNGILLDGFGATSAPDVYASGDAVRSPDEFFGRRVRSENWMHAQNQSIAVAKNTSDTVLRGALEANRFLMFHLPDGKIAGATSIINEPRDIKFARRLIDARVPVDPDQLKDPAT
jgi:3-phenylpropionate/trans-cinnamate dioxygenase ferredoxin reductase subunit